MHTHTHTEDVREKGRVIVKDTLLLSRFYSVVAVAVLDEQLIKENCLKHTAGLSLTLYKFTIVCCSHSEIKPTVTDWVACESVCSENISVKVPQDMIDLITTDVG